MNAPKVAMRIVGLASIALGLLGLLYNLATLFADFSSLVKEHNLPHFYGAFYTMSALCMACYIILLVCGVQFVRLWPGMLAVFVGVIVFEVVYFLAMGPMWLIPTIGMSIAAATGVANGGLMFQGFVLFPLWAPVLAGWAARRLAEVEPQANPGAPAGA